MQHKSALQDMEDAYVGFNTASGNALLQLGWWNHLGHSGCFNTASGNALLQLLREFNPTPDEKKVMLFQYRKR